METFLIFIEKYLCCCYQPSPSSSEKHIICSNNRPRIKINCSCIKVQQDQTDGCCEEKEDEKEEEGIKKNV